MYDLLSVFAEASVKGPEAGFRFDPVITLGDIAETLALPLTLLLALVTLKKTARDQRELALFQQTITHLHSIVAEANEVSQLVESNLKRPGADYRTQQKRTEALRKKLETELLVASALISEEHADALNQAHRTWYDATFCESWPRTPKTKGLSPGDGQILKLQKAREDWCKHVTSLSRSLVGELKPQKKKK